MAPTAHYANPVTGEVEKHELGDATWAEVKAGHPVNGARVTNGEEHLWTLEPPVEAPAPAGPPVVVDAPYVQGSGIIGEPLTCTMGNWQNMEDNPARTYQWKNPGSIAGATEPSYTPTAEDSGKDVGCTVTATNALGSASSDSNTVAVKAAARGR